MKKTSDYYRRKHWGLPAAAGSILILVVCIALAGQNVQAAVRPGPPPPEALAGEETGIVVIAGPPDAVRPHYVPPPAGFEAQGAESALSADIQITYLPSEAAWPFQARIAFEFAVSIWEGMVSSSVPIRVTARWEDLSNLGPNILGSAYASAYFHDFGSAQALPNTLYPVALANKLAGHDLYAGPDIEARFNSAFTGWYFGTDGNPGSQYDLVSVVLHELCHGLGFADSFEVSSSGLGNWGYGSGYPSIYDRYIVNGANQVLVNTYPNGSAQLAAQLTSNNLYFSGSNAAAANWLFNHTAPKVYAPYPFSSGSSIAHLDEIFNAGSNALMTFSLDPGEAIHNPGPIVGGAFTDIGWNVNPLPTSTATATATPTTPAAPPTATPSPTPKATPTITPTPSDFLYLPQAPYSYHFLSLWGRVTEGGAPVAYVKLELQRGSSSGAKVIQQTLTSIDGTYQFHQVRPLQAGEWYVVVYKNLANSSRLWFWSTSPLKTNPAGVWAHAGDFDIADVRLVAPPEGARIGLPVSFSWKPRPASPGDNYEFNLYNPVDLNQWWYTYPRLGYTGAYTLVDLPAGFHYNIPYRWELWVYDTQGGYGISYQYRTVTFAGAANQLENEAPESTKEPEGRPTAKPQQ